MLNLKKNNKDATYRPLKMDDLKNSIYTWS